MKLVVRDPVLAAVARHTTAATDGVARVHELPWLTGGRLRTHGRGVDVERTGETVLVSVRVVVRRGRRVIDVVRTVQQSVRAELLRLTGVTAEVVVVVVDLD